MKATELMIGDWVRIAPYDIIDQVDCLLTEYAVTSHGDTCCQYEYKDIEPWYEYHKNGGKTNLWHWLMGAREL